ncbi:MAG: hypothetical protein HOP37_12935 [Cyclobacteriaceae bacterium]|nr:hypothetical protein [Cyclobacteriaceae bacterium]
MKKSIFILGSWLVFTACSHQPPVNFSESSAFPAIKSSYQHQVMILGTFHFDRGLDGSDVIAKNHLNISDAENQRQILALVDTIVARYKPTVIAVEWMPGKQVRIDSLFQVYARTKELPGKNEAFQIGFRIAEKLNLPTIYAVDNRPPQPETVTELDNFEGYAQSRNQLDMMTEYDQENLIYNTFLDSLLRATDFSTYMRIVNSDANLKRSKQLWFTGLVNLGYADTYVGADLTGHWYRRNTRIFVNIRNLSKQKQERILVIYGMAHKWILEELFQGSPEFEVVSTSKILK